jgi:hypothetical protein
MSSLPPQDLQVPVGNFFLTAPHRSVSCLFVIAKILPPYTYFLFVSGMRFGLAQNKTCIVQVLSEFEIRKCDKTPKSLTPIPTAFIFSPIEEMWVDFVKRTDK